MPLAPVDDNGTVLFYEDSGAPNTTEAYNTLVMIHGITFTTGVFGRLLPFASQHQVRLIRVNQRDYPPSSLYTASEIEDFTSTDKDVQAQGLAKRGAEVANLLCHLIDTLKIPPVTIGNGGKAVGGISVLGWSMGAHLPLALLSNASALPAQVQQQLQRYLRSAILYDSSMFSVGVPIPPIVFTPERPKGLYWPSFDQSVSEQERLQQFSSWGASYFTPIDDISKVTLETLGERVPVQELPEETFRALNIEEWKKITTAERFIPDELATFVSLESMARYFVTLAKLDTAIHKDSFHRAVGLVKSAETPLVWPDCKLVVVWCDMSSVDPVIAAMTVANLLRDEGSNIKRKVELARLGGCNHFPHWDEPEKVMSFLAKQLQ